ncbi:hypothetical protein DFJ77DRAFT_520251 [Powellomyces hirtus]|nr:hypothetical protein DFJ77DRAFT_520251 [Powellomyces hirtus]
MHDPHVLCEHTHLPIVAGGALLPRRPSSHTLISSDFTPVLAPLSLTPALKLTQFRRAHYHLVTLDGPSKLLLTHTSRHNDASGVCLPGASPSTLKIFQDASSGIVPLRTIFYAQVKPASLSTFQRAATINYETLYFESQTSIEELHTHITLLKSKLSASQSTHAILSHNDASRRCPPGTSPATLMIFEDSSSGMLCPLHTCIGDLGNAKPFNVVGVWLSLQLQNTRHQRPRSFHWLPPTEGSELQVKCILPKLHALEARPINHSFS